MNITETYFTFPTDTLSYECRGCGACCKGLGVGMDSAAGQPTELLARLPQLAAFMTRKGGATVAQNPRGGCWFLDAEGLCTIENRWGRASKPASCRLFPFNRVFVLGTTRIVDFNSVICPLQAHHPGAEVDALSGRVCHDAILDEITSIGDPAIVGTRLDDAGLDPKRFIVREQRVARACFAQWASESPGEVDLDAVLEAGLPRRTSPAGARATVARAIEAVLGVERAEPSGQTLRRALLLTPSMRFNTLASQRGYPSSTEADVLPLLTLAWIHLLADAEVLAGRPLNLQQCTTIWSQALPLLYVFARWDEHPTLEPGPIELPDEPELRDRLVTFGELCTQQRAASLAPMSLGGIFARAADGVAPGAERAIFARALEPFYGRLKFGGAERPALRARPASKRKRKRR